MRDPAIHCTVCKDETAHNWDELDDAWYCAQCEARAMEAHVGYALMMERLIAKRVIEILRARLAAAEKERDDALRQLDLERWNATPYHIRARLWAEGKAPDGAAEEPGNQDDDLIVLTDEQKRRARETDQ